MLAEQDACIPVRLSLIQLVPVPISIRCSSMSSEPTPLRLARLNRVKNLRAHRDCRVKLSHVYFAFALLVIGGAVFWTLRAWAPSSDRSPDGASSVVRPLAPTPVLGAGEVLREALELRDGRLHRVDTGEPFADFQPAEALAAPPSCKLGAGLGGQA